VPEARRTFSGCLSGKSEFSKTIFQTGGKEEREKKRIITKIAPPREGAEVIRAG